MITRKHFLRFCHPEPGVSGTGDPTPEPTAAPAPEPAAATADAPAPDTPPADPGPDAAAAPADPFGGLNDLLDQVGQPETPAPAAAAPAVPPAVVESAATPAAPAPATAAPAPAAPAAPGQPDLTPPEGMSERASARWTNLTDRVKESDRRATEATQQLDDVRRLVSDSGLQPAEFQEALTIGRLVKSNDPRELQQALSQLDGLRTDIATRLGVDVAGVDQLAAHPDLKARVEAMELPRDAALEMVRLRRQSADATANSRRQQDHTTYVQTVQNAAAQMDATLAQRAHLPGHAAKVAHVQAYFSDPTRLQQFVSTYQPQQWQSAVLMMYDSFVPPAPAVAPAPPAPQPLRPASAGAGARVPTAPKNAMDAVENAFASLGM